MGGPGDVHVRLAALLASARGRRLAPDDWRRVAELLDHLAVDPTAVEGVHAELDALLRAVPIGALRDPRLVPAPDALRERFPTTTESLPVPADDRHGQPRESRDGLTKAVESAIGAAVGSVMGSAAVARASARRFWDLPLLDRGALGLAGTDPADAGVEPTEAEIEGMAVVLRTLGRREVGVTVAVPASTPGLFVELTVASEPSAPVYLLPLVAGADRVAVGSITVPVTTAQVRTRLSAPFASADLTDDDTAAVARSAPLAGSVEARGAWLDAAATRPRHDPVRTAVVDALR